MNEAIEKLKVLHDQVKSGGIELAEEIAQEIRAVIKLLSALDSRKD